MKRVQKLLLWFLMLCKRLYKKPTFLVLILLIPAVVFGYMAISGGESGIMTVGLVSLEEDPITQEIFDEFQNESTLMAFYVYEDPDEARSLLEAGKLDAVWIFPGNMAEKIEAFTQKPRASSAFIKVLQREENVALALSREKLSGAVYPYLSQRIYVYYLRDLAPELSHLSDEALLEYYLATDLTVDLFEFTGSAGQNKETNFLLSPMRGLLGTLILLCSLATAMYYIRDKQNGTFAWVSRRWQFLPELGCHLASSLHVSTICLICLAIGGLAGNIWMELTVVLLYSLCCSVFAMALRQVFGSLRSLGTMLPLIMVVSLVICPVFFDLGQLRQVQYILPPTYYINGVYDSRYLLYMTGYTAAAAGFALLLQHIKDHTRFH